MTTIDTPATGVTGLTDEAALRARVRVLLADLRARGRFTPTVDSWVTGWDEEFSQLLASEGLIGLTIPTEYGGRGRTYLERFAVTEELLAAGAPIAAHWIADRQIAPALLTHGTEEQKQTYLPRIAAGQCYFGLGMSEPESGSDLASVRTRATKVDGGWVMTGSKIWTSGAHKSEALIVLARTESVETAGRHGGLSQFIVGIDLPGVDVRPVVSSSGEHHFNEVFFNEVALSDKALLGQIGNGWAQVTQELAYERSGPERFLSAQPLLNAVFEDPGVTTSGADAGQVLARLGALHRMSRGVSRLLQDGVPTGVAAAQVKLLGGGFEGDVVHWAANAVAASDRSAASSTIDLLDNALVQRPSFTLRGGTTEILSDIIARGLVTSRARLAEHIGADADLATMISDVMTEIGRSLSERPDDETAYTEAWKQLDKLGLTQLTGDPGRGGSGAGWTEAVVLIESAAAHDVRLPLAEHDLLVGWLVEQTELRPPVGPAGCVVADTDGIVRNVRLSPVLREILVVGPDSTGLMQAGYVDAETVSQNSVRESGLGTVDFRIPDTGVTWTFLPPALVDELRLRGALARSAQMTGAIGYAVSSAIAHAAERKQFGQQLNRFQAVRALLASASAEASLAATVVASAVEVINEHGMESQAAWNAVAVAKSSVGRAAELVVRNVHQVHGAIGTTLEHDLHRHSGALFVWRRDFGDSVWWDREIATRTSLREDGSVWDFIVDGVE